MAIHKYLVLTPESLVVSMLRPESFGTYLATGTQKRSNEIAIFFDLKTDFENEYFGWKNLCGIVSQVQRGHRKVQFMFQFTVY